MHRSTAPHAIIRKLAEQGYGVVERSRLLDAGLSPTAIDHRLATGVLVPLHRSVYVVGHSHLREEGRWLAAVWSVGPEAVLSHHHAALLWGMLPEPPRGGVHVTLVGRAGRIRRRGVVVHRPRRLDEQDVTTHRGVPTATVARTLLDLALAQRGRRLEQMIRTAAQARVFDPAAVESVLERYPHHRGRRELGRVFGVVAERGTEDLRSGLEVRLLQLCDDHGFAKPVVNGYVAGERVDFHWASARLVVETDGFEWHATPTAFADDRRRDQRLALAGYRVLRFTYGDVREHPDRVLSTIATLLARTPTRGAA